MRSSWSHYDVATVYLRLLFYCRGWSRYKQGFGWAPPDPEVRSLCVTTVCTIYLRLLFLRRTELVSARIWLSSSRSWGRVSLMPLQYTWGCCFWGGLSWFLRGFGWAPPDPGVGSLWCYYSTWGYCSCGGQSCYRQGFGWAPPDPGVWSCRCYYSNWGYFPAEDGGGSERILAELLQILG